jgi:hypothetical protein
MRTFAVNVVFPAVTELLWNSSIVERSDSGDGENLSFHRDPAMQRFDHP